MGKIFNNMPSMIMEAMKAGESSRANAYRNLKAKMLEWKTSKEGAKIVNANNGEIPDAQEIIITKKYVTELLNDVEIYKNVKPIMAGDAQIEANHLSVFLPQEASESDIRVAVVNYITENGNYEQRQMGMVIKAIKSQFDNVDGKLLAEIVKSYIKHE